MQQATYWIGTVPVEIWAPESVSPLCSAVAYIRGQQEIGESGYHHWQLFVQFRRNVRLARVKELLQSGTGHWEPTRSQAAEEYVWKEDTRVPGTQFELGRKPFNRSKSNDWDEILASAKSGDFEKIPSDVLVRCYSQISRICKDNMVPVAVERSVKVYWGCTGRGKSRLAWEQAGLAAYPKDPSTKWWDGYNSQEHVVIDEFRGRVAVEHLLRWFDRYPVCVETKGGAVVLRAHSIWITSNLSPDAWYPELDSETLLALRRRLNITHFNYFFT